jgi:3-hydroxybutyrate dehydrogenase
MYHASKHAIIGFVRSMADLERVCGIRVAGVAPGVVKTPLWLDNPEKLRIIKDTGEGADEWITPKEVAEVMLAIVEKDEVSATFGVAAGNTKTTPQRIPIKGGCILEVTAGAVRDIPMFNNPGSHGLPGTTVSNALEIMQETVSLLKPGWGKR